MTSSDKSGNGNVAYTARGRQRRRESPTDRNVRALREVQISVVVIRLVCHVGCAQAVAERRSCAAQCSSNKITVTHSTRPQCSATGYNRIPQSAVVKTSTAHSVSMDAREIGVRFQSGADFFPFSTVPKSSLRLIQPPSPNLEHKADHLPPQGVQVKNAWSCIYTSPYVCMTCCFITNRDVTFSRMLN